MTFLPRALLVAALACATPLLAAAAYAQQPPVSLKALLEQLKVKWNKPTEPFRVIGNVYYVGTDGLASYLITGPQGHVLVDTGLIEANPQIKANIAKLGFKLADVKILINTHAHLDHTAGLAELKAETGAQMVAGEADKPILEGGYYPQQRRPEPRLRAREGRSHREVGRRRRTRAHPSHGHHDARTFTRLYQLGDAGGGSGRQGTRPSSSAAPRWP